MRQHPLLRLLVPFVAGIAAGLSFAVPLPVPAVILCICIILMAVAVLRKRPGRNRVNFGLFTLPGMISAGFLSVGVHSLWRDLPFQDTAGTYAGKVLEKPLSRGERFRVLMLLEPSGNKPEGRTGGRRVHVYLPADSLAGMLVPGDLVLLKGKVREVPPPLNPEEFNYRRYLLNHGIAGQVFLQGGEWMPTGKCAVSRAGMCLKTLRSGMIERLRETGAGEREFQVWSSLSLGYREELDPTTRRSYARAGAMHFLAISGLHVGIMYLLFSSALGFLVKIPHGKLIRMALVLVLLWLYALLTGMSPSVSRAVTMFSFFAIGNALHRHVSVYNILAASAFFLLLADPFMLNDVGFQLSYLAVGGIIYFQPRLYRLWEPGNPVVSKVWALITVALAAQLVTFPLTVHYFHFFPVYFLLSNLVVLPLVSLLLGISPLFFILGFFPPAAGLLAGTAAWITLAMNELVECVESLPGAALENLWLGREQVLVLYLLLLSAWLFVLRKKTIWFWGACALLAIFLAGRQRLAMQREYRHDLVVYRVPGGTMVARVKGRSMTADIRGGEEAGLYDYQTLNHRILMAVREIVPLQQEGLAETAGSDIYLGEYAWYIRGKRKTAAVSLPDLSEKNSKGPPLKTDILVVTRDSRLKPEELGKYFSPSLVVLDSSLGSYLSGKWMEYLVGENIPFHTVWQQGAFVTSL